MSDSIMELWLGFLLFCGMALGVAAVVGWCMNIYKLAIMCCDFSGMIVVRGAGIIVAPLGAVVGYL